MRISLTPICKAPHTATNLRATPYLCCLFLEGVQDAVDKLLLQLVIDVSCTQVTHDLLNGLHHHLPVLLSLVLQVVDDTRDDLGCAHLICQLHRCVYQLWGEA